MPHIRPHGGKDSNGALVGFLAGCLTGAVIGAAVGILLAPHRGDITRRKLARRAGQTRDQVVEKVEDLLVHRKDEEGKDADKEADR